MSTVALFQKAILARAHPDSPKREIIIEEDAYKILEYLAEEEGARARYP